MNDDRTELDGTISGQYRRLQDEQSFRLEGKILLGTYVVQETESCGKIVQRIVTIPDEKF